MKSEGYRLVAIQVGDILKYSTTLNVIDRAAKSVFPFSSDHFPNDAITSERAQLIHDWILTLARCRRSPDLAEWMVTENGVSA